MRLVDFPLSLLPLRKSCQTAPAFAYRYLGRWEGATRLEEGLQYWVLQMTYVRDWGEFRFASCVSMCQLFQYMIRHTDRETG